MQSDFVGSASSSLHDIPPYLQAVKHFFLALLQDESEQRPHKLSYHVAVKGDDAEKVVAKLETKLTDAGAVNDRECHLKHEAGACDIRVHRCWLCITIIG